ncbi:hypothetical protein [Streptomyces halobius]|uniref:RDD family protein n=1 Tax=Streptomyces halobius TaxID=2879846 RepID=A0ABY4LZ35_9ACTN|nr:hypothetical protein [Streptomyces halobius]UQA90770.1 hypothetical protein K9S39_01700 [Streptomyces halobius]
MRSVAPARAGLGDGVLDAGAGGLGVGGEGGGEVGVVRVSAAGCDRGDSLLDQLLGLAVFAAYSTQAASFGFTAVLARQRAPSPLGRFGLGSCLFRSGGGLGLGGSVLLALFFGPLKLGAHSLTETVLGRLSAFGPRGVGHLGIDLCRDPAAQCTAFADKVVAHVAVGAGVHPHALVAPGVAAFAEPGQAPAQQPAHRVFYTRGTAPLGGQTARQPTAEVALGTAGTDPGGDAPQLSGGRLLHHMTGAGPLQPIPHRLNGSQGDLQLTMRPGDPPP